MIDIEKIVKENCSDGYKIVTKTVKTRETFFVGKKIETVRATENNIFTVTVYSKNKDGSLGDSTFPVYESMDENALKVAVKNAVGRAELVHNKAYELEKGGKEEYEISSDMKNTDQKEIADKVASAVWKAKTVDGGNINALEIFVTEEKTQVKLSTGLDKTQKIYKISVEAIPTHTDERESVELYQWFSLTELDGDKITSEIERKLKEVYDRHNAVKGKKATITVALRPAEIADLVFSLADVISYAAKYQQRNAFDLGEDLQKDGTGDKLNITLKGIINGSSHSAFFDADGVTLKDRTLVKDGKVVSLWGSSRFGQYIGEKDITGVLSCLSLGSGTANKNKDRFLECASLSGLQVDIYNDYIGGEIRLAYLHEGDKVTPVTGISMSGKLSEVLPYLTLTSDKVTEGSYEGPSLMFLKDMQII